MAQCQWLYDYGQTNGLCSIFSGLLKLLTCEHYTVMSINNYSDLDMKSIANICLTKFSDSIIIILSEIYRIIIPTKSVPIFRAIIIVN